MGKIIYTIHAIEDVFPELRGWGFKLDKRDIRKVILHPDNLDTKSDFPNIIASKSLNERHILRVVYKVESGIIKVITFYPAEKGRYY